MSTEILHFVSYHRLLIDCNYPLISECEVIGINELERRRFKLLHLLRSDCELSVQTTSKC